MPNAEFLKTRPHITDILLQGATAVNYTVIVNEQHYISVPRKGFDAWTNGELIQRALPSLTKDECELLMTGMTPEDWDKMMEGFGGEDD